MQIATHAHNLWQEEPKTMSREEKKEAKRSRCVGLWPSKTQSENPVGVEDYRYGVKGGTGPTFGLDMVVVVVVLRIVRMQNQQRRNIEGT